MKYAENTTVPIERSRSEIETVLKKYGAEQFMYFSEERRAVLAFRLKGCNIQLSVMMPRLDEIPARIGRGYGRLLTAQKREERREQMARQRWRALVLYVKAKLEFIENELSTVEQEFMAQMMLPSGETVADWLLPQIETARKIGVMPRLLTMPTGGTDDES